ncbi:MAG: phenylalanine--tRNA ligase subunit beta [Saprospiraceae bacterium]
MNISLNWLKDYLSVDLPPEQIGEILTSTGLEVEGMEEIESIKGGLEGVVIGHVKTCGKHPNADRLSLTTVDVGTGEDLQIVCGAPNVAAGQKVLVATIGTKLYDKEGGSFTIKKGKMRGEVSEGMICAEDELGLGESHDGIMVLPEATTVGQTAKEYFNIESDIVYEIGLTPNRSDATNHIGVAKDLAAALKINHAHNGQVKVPEVTEFAVDNNTLTIPVEVENKEACPRYAGVSISNVTVGTSPDWLQKRLNAIGVRPINNIVDVTNFVLHEFGQPLHAFDFDKIEGRKVIVRSLPTGTVFNSLDEVERKLHEEDLMICDGNSNGMCIAGVFGGINSGVIDATKNIFLESACFDAKTIRKTSTRHLLRTDAATTFEKGVDPNITIKALKRAALLIKELAGGEIASEIVDIYPNPVEKHQVEVSYKNVNRLIGTDIPKEKTQAILAALEIDILNDDGEKFTVAIPTNKVDVLREADVIEEILRIYGFDQVPLSGHIKMAVIPTKQPEAHKVRNTVGTMLAAKGFNEIMALSLTQEKYFDELYPVAKEELVYVNNTSNIHLNIMRPTMLLGGLESVLHNQNRKQADLRLFEFGRSYKKLDEENFEETEHLSVWMSGQSLPESWMNKDKNEVTYYNLKSLVQQVLDRMGASAYQQTAINEGDFSYGMRYHRGAQVLVEFGEVKKSILKGMGIKRNVFYADFNWESLMKVVKKQKIGFVPLSKFPTVRRDLALVIENSVNFEDIAAIARKTGKKLLKEVNLFDVYKNEEQVGKGKKSYAVSFLFEDPSKTLKDKEVDKIMQQLIRSYEEKVGAIIRK